MNSILKIYEERQKDKIEKEYSDKCKEIMIQDSFQNLTTQYNIQLHELYKIEYDEKLNYDYGITLVTKETKEKIDEIKEDKITKLIELNNKLEEVEAQLSIIPTDNYSAVRKVLKNYGIFNNDYKINS